MDLRQGKSGFPDRSLLGAGGSGPMAFIATEILTKAPPDLRLLGHLVSGFHMIRLKQPSFRRQIFAPLICMLSAIAHENHYLFA